MSNPIGWCEETWNPVTGCTPISPGCQNCYARRMAQRLKGRYGYPADDPFRPGTWHPSELEKPLHWRKPRFIFVVSMGDLFHEAVSDGLTGLVLSMTIMAPQHTYLFLTKRPKNMREHIASFWLDKVPPSNVWPGVTVCNQAEADEKIPVLLSIPAAVHFVSVEPLLGPLVLPPDFLALGKRAWAIVGGETGPGARPMWPDWPRSLRDQCSEAGVKFWFKKWGDYKGPDDWTIPAGRLLDGREWSERP